MAKKMPVKKNKPEAKGKKAMPFAKKSAAKKGKK